MFDDDPMKRYEKVKAFEEQISKYGQSVDHWFIHRARNTKNYTEVALLILQGRGLAESLFTELAKANLEITALSILNHTVAADGTLFN